MIARQFSNKSKLDKGENKNSGTKTLPSSPHNFQLRAVDTTESSKVDSSNGVAQLAPIDAAALMAMRAVGKVATRAAPRAGGALGKVGAGVGAGIGGAALFNYSMQAADYGSQAVVGHAFGDQHMKTKAGIGAATAVGQTVAPGFGDEIGELGEYAQTQTLANLTRSGINPVIDEESGRPLSDGTTGMLDTASNMASLFPLLSRFDIVPGIKAGNNMAGRAAGVRDKMEQDYLQDGRAAGKAEVDQMTGGMAAEFAINNPQIDAFNKGLIPAGKPVLPEYLGKLEK